MGGVIAHLTPEVVAACNAAESQRGPAYVMACDLIPAFARRYADGEDVASVARVILASVMVAGYAGSDAAHVAISRAASWIGSDRIGTADAPKVRAIPAGDTTADLVDLPADDVSAPDRIARWTARDTLAAVWDALDDTGAAVMAGFARPDVWSQDERGRSDKINKRALGRAIYGRSITGRAMLALSDNLAACQDDMRHLGRTMQRHNLPAMPTGHGEHERGPVRYDDKITGPASAVVVTTCHGARWVTLSDRSVMVTDDAARYVLAQVDTLTPNAVPTVRETKRAEIGAPRDLLPARRPAGVGIGLVYGNGQRAGGGAPEPRPVGSRKRKRDGGIGSPMVPA